MNTVFKHKSRLLSAVLIFGFAHTLCHGSERHIYVVDSPVVPSDDHDNPAFPMPTRGNVSFEHYQKWRDKQPLKLVLGCGRIHRGLTTAGLPHDHSDAYTVDTADDKPSRGFEVACPHLSADATKPITWQEFQENGFASIKFEHLPFTANFIQPSEKAKYDGIAREICKNNDYATLDAAKTEIIQRQNFARDIKQILELSTKYLMAGGTLEILPAFPNGYGFDNIYKEAAREEPIAYRTHGFSMAIDWLSPEAFSKLELTFYVLDRKKYPPELLQEGPSFELDLRKKKEDLPEFHKAITTQGAEWFKRDEAWNYVTVKLTKADDTSAETAPDSASASSSASAGAVAGGSE